VRTSIVHASYARARRPSEPLAINGNGAIGEDARAFDVDTTRRKQLGALAPGVIQSRQTLAEFVEEEWWPRYAIPNLASDTRRRYLEVWSAHLLPRLGEYELRQITPMVVEDLREQMARARVGTPTQRKTLMLLQGILKRAVVRGLVPVNSAQLVDKPKQKPTQLPQPLAPITVERIRANMLRPADKNRPGGRSWQAATSRIRDLRRIARGSATERADRLDARLCRVAPDRGPRLHLERRSRPHASRLCDQDGRPRDIDLVAPLAQDLAAWRTVCGGPPDSELIIPRPSGGQWTREDWANWRLRVWRPAAIEAGVTGDLRPYRLRGSFVSLLLWEGRSLTYVAEQAGHSVATLARHYAGTLRELETKPRMPAAEAIQQARDEI
jgi:site-specific recombinase XerD